MKEMPKTTINPLYYWTLTRDREKKTVRYCEFPLLRGFTVFIIHICSDIVGRLIECVSRCDDSLCF